MELSASNAVALMMKLKAVVIDLPSIRVVGRYSLADYSDKFATRTLMLTNIRLRLPPVLWDLQAVG